MNYITVDEETKKITGHFCGEKKGIPMLEGERLVEVPDDQNEIVVNLYEDEYDENFKLRPLKDRIADGSARWVPDSLTVDEKNPEQLRFKTRVELIKEGKEQLDRLEKLVGDEIVLKSLDEQLAEGLIHQDKYDEIKAAEREAAINRLILDNFPKWMMAGYGWTQMRAAVEELQNTLPE